MGSDTAHTMSVVQCFVFAYVVTVANKDWITITILILMRSMMDGIKPTDTESRSLVHSLNVLVT